MNVLELFAGASGGILASGLLGWKTVCAVEVDPYCREILLRRQEEGFLEPFPVWDDVQTFNGRAWRGTVDIIAAGFPCQPFSSAGKRRGKDDPRNMWPDTIRVLREVGPRFALLENVPGLVRTSYFGEILGDLAEAGFDARWDVVSAAEVGAPHIRKRLWILCHAQREQLQNEPGRKCGSRREGKAEPGNNGQDGDVANAKGSGLSIDEAQASAAQSRPARGGWWQTEPDVGRVADGLAYRVERLRAIGSGQVPRVAVEAWRRLTGE